MTLLQSIAKSAAAAAAGDLSPLHSNFPIISSSDQILPNLQIPAQSQTLTLTLTKPSSEWKIPDLDSDLNDLITNLCFNLKSKLKNPRNFKKPEFFSLINSFFEKCSSKLQVQIPSGPKFTLSALDKLGVLISREVAGLIAESCVLFEIWDVLEIIIERKILGNLNSFNLMEKLAEKNRTGLICLCVRKISNLRAWEIRTVLKYLLSPTKDSYDVMIMVRKELEKEAFLAIEKIQEKGLSKEASNLAREASIILMMAHDGFSSSETCLHYVFSSGRIDVLVLSSAISKLDGFEVLGLVRYFVKWLEKYERFPQARGCPSAAAVLGFSSCESIPTLKEVVNGLKLVLDEHFSYVVLNSEFRDELKKVQSVVGLLVSEGDLWFPVDSVLSSICKKVEAEEG